MESYGFAVKAQSHKDTKEINNAGFKNFALEASRLRTKKKSRPNLNGIRNKCVLKNLTQNFKVKPARKLIPACG